MTYKRMPTNNWNNPNNLKALLMIGKILNLVVWLSVLAILADNHQKLESNRSILLNNQSTIEHLKEVTNEKH